MTHTMQPDGPEPTRTLSAEPPPRNEAPPRGSGAWIGILLLVLAGGGGFWAYSQFGDRGAGSTAAKPAPRSTPVKASTVRKGDLKLYLTGLGNVTPLNSVTLRSRVDGQIIKVAFTEGQLVHEGDLLIEIDPRPFEVMLSQSEAQLAKDQALLKNARIDLERYQQAKNAVAAILLVTQEATVSQAEAAVRADQAQIDSVKLQLVYCRITAPTTGRIGLRLVDSGNMVRAADATGLAVITQTQPITVVFNLPEELVRPLLPQIRSGVEFPVDAFDRDMRTILASGKLLALDNQVDASTGTLRIKAVFPNKDELLLPNQFVSARLLATTRKDAVIAPTAALQRNPQSTIVYVVKVEPPAPAGSPSAPPKAEPPQGEKPREGKPKGESVPSVEGKIQIRTVTMGPSEGEETVIEHGLAPGEIVVTDGVEKLEQDSRVKVVDPTAKEQPPKGTP
jgi:multidrug efflux system membrane fusion protein